MKLRPYQQEVARAVVDSILNKKGIVFSVEIARQGGKNELSAHLHGQPDYEARMAMLKISQNGALPDSHDPFPAARCWQKKNSPALSCTFLYIPALSCTFHHSDRLKKQALVRPSEAWEHRAILHL